MKIAYYTSWSWAEFSRKASRVNVVRMCEAFSKAGHDVTLIGSEKSNYDLVNKYGLKHPFKMSVIPRYKGKKRWIVTFFRLFKLLKLTLGNYDLIFTRRTDISFLFLNTPFVIESHEFRITKNVDALLKMANLVAMPVITEPIRNDYVNEFPFLAEKIIVAPDAATVPSEHYISDINRCETVGYVGHLYEGRGIDIIAELAKAFPHLKFNMVGGEEDHIVLWKSRCSDIENLRFLGYVPHGRLGDYYKELDIVLAPYQETVRWGSKTDVDTSKRMSPLKIFEYMSFRKPMLVSDSPVLYEVLNDEKNCLICEKANIESWKKQLQRLIDDVELRKKLSSQAYSDFIENYTWDARVSRILELAQKHGIRKPCVWRNLLHIVMTILRKLLQRISLIFRIRKKK